VRGGRIMERVYKGEYVEKIYFIHVLMYENGKMRHVEAILKMGEGGIKKSGRGG
jgi:hypothetical protein